MQKASSKMYVFVTVILLMSISKRLIQWIFVIANVTSNKFSAISKNFRSPIIIGLDNSYIIPIPWYIEYRIFEPLCTFLIISKKKLDAILTKLLEKFFLYLSSGSFLKLYEIPTST